MQATDNTLNIQYLKGVGEKRAHLLHKLGVNTIDALLHFYPRAYLDFKTVYTLDNPDFENNRCYRLTICSEIEMRENPRTKICKFWFLAGDGKGECEITVYGKSFSAGRFVRGASYLFYGKMQQDMLGLKLISPDIKMLSDNRLIPVYPLTAGISSANISTIVKTALEKHTPKDVLSDAIKAEFNLLPLREALYKIHLPTCEEDYLAARRRLAFEELFLLQTAFFSLKTSIKQKDGYTLKENHTEEFIRLLPFDLTTAQRRVISECNLDMASGKPMNRLVEGDVGSGKTAVAAALCYNAVKNGLQCAIMAPTEVLAKQHQKSFGSFFCSTGIRCELLTGSLIAKQKRELKERLKGGEIDVLIGTHALISDGVEFKNLGLSIVDEQHRFGVTQRSALSDKGICPHRLVLSATPIPRTLSLIVYGELDISIIDEIPGNRPKIKSYAVDTSYRNRFYEFLRKEVKKGNRGYIVCPAIEENENGGDLVSAESYYENLKNNVFTELNVGLLHGKMKAAEKAAAMDNFASGKTDILVSTSVIEVGIDVPKATVMIIENAERFGLSQLHQLRGRIGRGVNESYCIFVSDKKDNERLKIMCSTLSGFKIAESDLKLRGPGDFIGQRQHGLPEMKIADLTNDIELFYMARDAAKKTVECDSSLSKPENSVLKVQINSLLNKSELS